MSGPLLTSMQTLARAVARNHFSIFVLLVLLLEAPNSAAQELEPRRWSHLPTGGHFFGGGPLATRGDIFFDPVLRAEDAELEMDTVVLKYIRSFELFDKSARVSIQQGHQNGTWSGLLDGVPTTIRRVGATDTQLRFAINLKGAPPLRGQEYLRFRGSASNETIVGLGLVVQLPTGEYFFDKLLNLGTNRYTFRPQLGVVRSWNSWTLEGTVSLSIFSENDDFFGGDQLEQDPLLFLQGHLIRNFSNGRWLGLSMGYGNGGEATISGVDKNDRRKDVGWALSYGFQLGPASALKIAYAGTNTRTDVGLDSDSLLLTFSRSW